MLKRQSGFSDIRIGLIGAIPYIAGFAAMLFAGWHSDRNGERRWHAAVPLFIAGAAMLGLVTQPQSMLVTVILFTLVGINIAYLPVSWAIPTELLSASAAAAAVGMINAVGSVAGFAGPYAFGYLRTQTGSFAAGLAVITVSTLAAGLLLLRVPRSRRASDPSASSLP